MDEEQEAVAAESAAHVARAVADGGRVLVRCHWGVNRSGLVTGLALVARGLTAPESITLVRARRSPWALCNSDFVDMINRRAAPRGTPWRQTVP